MVHMRLLAIDLAKNRRLVLGRPGSAVNCNFRIEGELRAVKHAYGGAGIVRSSESAGAGVEIARSKLVTDARGARFDVHQAIVAHGMDSSVPHLLRLTRGADHGSPPCVAPMDVQSNVESGYVEPRPADGVCNRPVPLSHENVRGYPLFAL